MNKSDAIQWVQSNLEENAKFNRKTKFTDQYTEAYTVAYNPNYMDLSAVESVEWVKKFLQGRAVLVGGVV